MPLPDRVTADPFTGPRRRLSRYSRLGYLPVCPASPVGLHCPVRCSLSICSD